MITALLSSLLLLVAPVVTIQPGTLDRGPHEAGPHIDGRTLHDGSVELRLGAPSASFLGMSGDRYVVRLSRVDGSGARVAWVRADGRQRVITSNRDASADPILSEDGRHLIATPFGDASSTTVRVRSARSGRILVTRTFQGSVSVLDASAGRAVVGGWSPNRTFWWEFDGTDDVSPINRRVGYFADISADRLASYTRDPYRDGCSVLTTLTGSRLSKSCKERVTAVSPSGARVATIHILSDGIGPNSVKVRRASGRALATYEAPYFFGRIAWESDTSLLLDTFGKRKWATVRCDLEDCERASALKRTPRF